MGVGLIQLIEKSKDHRVVLKIVDSRKRHIDIRGQLQVVLKDGSTGGSGTHAGRHEVREMDEKNMHNLFLKNMAGLIEEIKNPSPCTNPNSKRGGMATHAGVALELGIKRPSSSSGG